MVTDYHGFFLYVPNYRIIEFFFSHGWSRIITDIYFLSRIIEFFFFTRSSTENHGYIYLVTNHRIIEFLFTRSSTENHGFIFFVMNSLIRKFGIKKNIRDIP